ncbi:hypothetical protein Tco_0601417 [Tanacetum coccineum]
MSKDFIPLKLEQLYLAKNDKVRIRAKCFGRNPVFILDGEGPSTTDVGPKKKTIKGKGKQDDTPLGPNKKGISSGGRELRRANHDTTIKIEVERDSVSSDENTRMFKRIYICLGPLKKGFKACGRDLLGLDGAFMKGPYPDIRSCSGISMEKRWKKQWNGQAYKELLWRCASVTTVPYFDKAMQDLKDFNKECFEWLAKIPPHSWSRSHFSGRAKSDILLNNLCECFNGKILDARDAPIITALEYIREYLMRRMVNVIAVIKKTDGPLTPSATKLLKIAMDRANNCTVAFNGGEEYEVKGQSAANYNMSLNGVQVGIPEEWVDKCYWLATWQKTYSYTIGCLNGRVMWKKSQIPTTLTPPKHNTPVGRPRKNRRKSKEEKAEMVKDGKLSRAYKTVTCMKCGNLGHNSRSCKGQKDPYTGTSQTTPSTAPTMIHLMQLKFLKAKIREWNKSNMLSVKNVKAKYKEELEALEAIIDRGDGNEEIVNKRTEVVNNIQKFDKIHSSEMAQKAKVKWSIERDENTSFFHGVLNKKRSILNIRGIMVDGN